MPEVRFSIRWPDGSREDCYSPSLVIKDHLEAGASYPLADFRARCSAALHAASERVRAKFGFPCSRAASQLARLEQGCERFSHMRDASVRVETFHE